MIDFKGITSRNNRLISLDNTLEDVSQITIHEALLNVMAVAAEEPLQDNPFQPGFIREVILANALGHEVNCQKRR